MKEYKSQNLLKSSAYSRSFYSITWTIAIDSKSEIKGDLGDHLNLKEQVMRMSYCSLDFRLLFDKLL